MPGFAKSPPELGFAKSPPELVERFSSIASELPQAERRQMFGYPCLFVRRNVVSGPRESAWVMPGRQPA